MMECNKEEEAMRAKEIAEKQMQAKDFKGALLFILKAQHLYPDLENLSQMLTVCNVCLLVAEHNKVGSDSEQDWYGILQVDQTADEASIRTQYRKLALLLHPDKNKFSGAEEAFQLIGDALMVISDQAKRSLYDKKRKVGPKVAAEKQPPSQQQKQQQKQQRQKQQQQREHQQREKQLRQKQLQEQKQREKQQLQEQKQREKQLQEQKQREKQLQEQKQWEKQQQQRLLQQWLQDQRLQQRLLQQQQQLELSESRKQSAASRAPGRGNAEKKMQGKNFTGTKFVAKKVSEMNVKAQEMKKKGNTGQKRSRNEVVDSSENCENTAKDVVNSPNSKRSRKDGSSDGSDSKSCKSIPPGDSGEGEHNRSAPVKEQLPNGKERVGTHKTNGSEQVGVEKENETSNFDANPKEKFDAVPMVKSRHVVTNDVPKFYNFNDDKNEGKFKVEQIWAIYDNAEEGMPRCYAQINEILSPLKLWITWLVNDPEDQDDIDLSDRKWPVSIGNFRLGDTEYTKDLTLFSHLVSWEKGMHGRSYRIYPRKGEIWAIYKNWNIKWSTDQGDPIPYGYEIVEILSDYAKGNGFNVGYLVKVEHYVFRRQSANNVTVTFRIPSYEIFRFSHRIPSYEITEEESIRVPEGCIELDPFSLPSQFLEFDDGRVDDNSISAQGVGLCPQSTLAPCSEEKPKTPVRSVEPNKKNIQEKKRDYSPRTEDGAHEQKIHQENSSESVEPNEKKTDNGKLGLSLFPVSETAQATTISRGPENVEPNEKKPMMPIRSVEPSEKNNKEKENLEKRDYSPRAEDKAYEDKTRQEDASENVSYEFWKKIDNEEIGLNWFPVSETAQATTISRGPETREAMTTPYIEPKTEGPFASASSQTRSSDAAARAHFIKLKFMRDMAASLAQNIFDEIAVTPYEDIPSLFDTVEVCLSEIVASGFGVSKLRERINSIFYLASELSDLRSALSKDLIHQEIDEKLMWLSSNQGIIAEELNILRKEKSELSIKVSSDQTLREELTKQLSECELRLKLAEVRLTVVDAEIKNKENAHEENDSEITSLSKQREGTENLLNDKRSLIESNETRLRESITGLPSLEWM